jgi:hypothetical protein
MRAANVFFMVFFATTTTTLASTPAGSGYSGFWKTDCNNSFGLQIVRTKANLYSVSFCGPGGCAAPGTYLPNTSIDEDPMYEVISKSEIRLKLKGGGSVTHFKCTSNTHPVLIYPSTGV